MLAFKLWYMCVGSVLTAWFMLASSIFLVLYKRKENEGRKSRLTLALVLAFLAVAMFIYLVFPSNFQVVYNLGGI